MNMHYQKGLFVRTREHNSNNLPDAPAPSCFAPDHDYRVIGHVDTGEPGNALLILADDSCTMRYISQRHMQLSSIDQSDRRFRRPLPVS